MIYLHATNAWGVIGLKTSHREREIEIKTLLEGRTREVDLFEWGDSNQSKIKDKKK